MIMNCLAVGAGGFIGSVFRYLIGLIPLLHRGALPLQTLSVNIMGAVMIGLIVAASKSHIEINENMMLFLKVGICGGFTTFSTFALESADMIQGGQWIMSMVYIVLSVVICIAGIYLGEFIGESMFS